MRRLLCCLLCLCSMAGTMWAAQTKAYTPEMVPNVQVQDARRYVTDEVGWLSADERNALDERLAAIRANYGVEFVMVLLPSIGDEPIAEFSNALFRLWGLGDKQRNNGLLLLVVADARQSRFEVGYGAEGVLPDAMTYKIQEKALNPNFKQGDYARGLLAATEMVSQALAGDADMVPADRREQTNQEPVITGREIVVVCLLILVAISIFSLIDVLQTAKARSLKAGNGALMAVTYLKRTGVKRALLFLVLMPPTGLLMLIMVLISIKRYRQQAAVCVHCGYAARNVLEGAKLGAVLDRGHQLETEVHGCQHVAYECPQCGVVDVVALPSDEQEKPCNHCHYYTLMPQEAGRQLVDRRSQKPYVQQRCKCANCGEEQLVDKVVKYTFLGMVGAVIWQIFRAIFYILLSGGGRSGGGGFSGGFGGGGSSGGGFGGGSSGGGGSTSGW